MKEKYYYLGQPIQHYAGKELSQRDNWSEAFNFAQKVVKEAVKRKIKLYSPAAYTIHLAVAWEMTESDHDREYYIAIDDVFIEMMRKAGELVWIMHPMWFNSRGCREEVENALIHDEKVICFEEFFCENREVLIWDNIKFPEEKKVIDELYEKVIKKVYEK